MENTRIFARSIQHLTDARYFAAMGVDWMSFDLRQISSSFIPRMEFEAIKDWVEGPKICVHSEQEEDDITIVNYDRFNGETQCIVETDLDTLLALKEMPKVEALIICEMDIDNLMTNSTFLSSLGVPYYLDTHLSPAFATMLRAKIPNAGIVLYGAAEEKLGFKDFDEIDQIIENFTG